MQSCADITCFPGVAVPRTDVEPLEFSEPATAQLNAAQASSLPWRERVVDRVRSQRGRWVVVALAAALALPSLALGLTLDDRLNVYRVQHGQGPFTQFRIQTEHVAYYRQTGAFSWWTNPELSIDFLRPISALTNYAEYRLYPAAPWLMHLVNVLLYATLAALAWRLYREFLPNCPGPAALAAVMFAIDDGHAPTVGWISGRNTLLASLFGLAALAFHARARRVATRAWQPAVASVVCIALALFSAEAGLAAFAYLLAYGVALDSASIRSRLLSVLPAFGVFAIWAGVYLSRGYGAHGAGLYRALTFSTLGEGLADLPSWLLSALGPSTAGVTVPFPAGPIRIAASALLLPLLAAFYLALPRTRENHFFGLGALLCLPPLFTTLPQDRLLILASFGAFGLIASFIATAKQHATRFVRGTRRALIGLHFVVAPLMFGLMLNQTAPIEAGARALAQAIPRDAPAQVVFVNLPTELLTLFGVQTMLDEPGRKLPDSVLQLYGGSSRLVATRVNANTFELYAAKGWGDLPAERVFASLSSLPRAGDELSIGPTRVRVLETDDDGHPRRVQFHFPDALESSDRLWFTWRGTRPEPWRPPAIGQQVEFAPLDVMRNLPAF